MSEPSDKRSPCAETGTPVAAIEPRVMRFAYADPPYLGTSRFGARHHYGEHHADATDYDTPEAHQALISRLVSEFPDGWALSLHTPSLRTILPMCPEDVRVAAWVKSFAAFKPGVNPAYAWEPVIFRGGRSAVERGGKRALTVRDWVSHRITFRKGLSGAKPEVVCRWILDLLGYRDGDELIDIFPGSGVMGRVLSEGRLAV